MCSPSPNFSLDTHELHDLDTRPAEVNSPSGRAGARALLHNCDFELGQVQALGEPVGKGRPRNAAARDEDLARGALLSHGEKLVTTTF
jgi:hypothetical protein